MSITMNCQCGQDIEYDEDEYLDSEDYTPHEIVCDTCGAKYRLCIHVELVKTGDPGKKWPDDDPMLAEREKRSPA